MGTAATRAATATAAIYYTALLCLDFFDYLASDYECNERHGKNYYDYFNRTHNIL